MATPQEPDHELLQQRLEQLIEEQPNGPSADAPRPTRSTHRLSRPLTLGVVVALALMIGIQLGSLPWRYRRQIWQAQGVVVGLALGVVIGRLSVRRLDP